ncbi:outer membrane beta-barrel protein [Pedobacter hiemivivus]|nr:outer membrane beta-barrel protein [Pedobacter hiemivivus]
MVKCSFLLYFFIFLFTNQTKAQNLNIAKGKVIDYTSKSPIPNAIIQIYNDSKVVYKTSTDSLGFFSIPLNTLVEYTNLKIQNINYQPLNIPKPTIDSKKRSSQALGIFELLTSSIQLKEVVIRKNKRYRDTTVIDLSKKKFERTIMISDILSGNNGFYIDGAGQLFYKGKQVTDVTVDGGTFFGRNNLNIYENLPALVLKDIQIVETDIDSLTNITMIRPLVKVNLSFKGDYKKGMFGSANLGLGTLTRYIVSTNLYRYKKSEQISFAINSNNINVNTSQPSEPSVMFSAGGNNTIKTIPKIEYRNVFLKKLEVMTSINAAIENKTSISELERKEEILNQQTRLYNSSKMRSLNIDQSSANLIYRINSQNTIKANFNIEYYKTNQSDTLDYNIRLDSLNTISNILKNRINTTKMMSYEALFNKSFLSKKGRSLSIGIKNQKRIFRISENNNVYTLDLQKPIRFFLNGTNYASENEASINLNFINSLSESSVLFFGLNYKRSSINYNETINSDTLKNNGDIVNKVINDYLNPSLKMQKNFDNISVTGYLGGIINFRNTGGIYDVFFRPDIDLNSDFKINKKTNFNIKYAAKSNYPIIDQLTNINNSFNLISQNSGNPSLKPELKQRLGFAYEFKRSDSLMVSFLAGAELISSKFGFNIISSPNNLQQTQIANVGRAIAADAAFSLSFLAKKGKNINFRSALAYQQMPSIVNTEKTSNNGITFNQVLSTKIALIKGLLTISPSLSISNSIYKYGTSKSSFASFTYSDRLSIQIQTIQIILFPFINYSTGIRKNSSWAMNAEIKKNIFKNSGSIWLKSYDVFNSFRYVNNIIGPSYIETLKYVNLQRYSLLGISVKFNTIK